MTQTTFSQDLDLLKRLGKHSVARPDDVAPLVRRQWVETKPVPWLTNAVMVTRTAAGTRQSGTAK